jgi:predicted dehydrogenase
MPKLRIGFIGAGSIAVGHAKRLAATGLAEVVALADPNEQSIERLKQQCPEASAARAFRDYTQMLDSMALDAVEILSPHTLHAEQILAALGRGLHVLCEKPMTCTVEEARQVIARRDETGKILMISYQRHYHPAYRYMRELATGGKLGRLNALVLVLTQEWLRATAGTWRQDPMLSGGGQLNDSGSHIVDMMLWCTGLQPSTVYAQINHYGAPVDVDTALTVRFQGNAIGNVTILGSTPGYWEMFAIHGSEGSVSYDTTIGLLQHFHGREPEKPELPEPSSDPDANFVRAILGLEEVQTPAECGLAVISFTEAAWRSAATGKPVTI